MTTMMTIRLEDKMTRNDPFEEPLGESEQAWITEKAEVRQERWEERVIKRLISSRVGASASSAVVRTLKNESLEKTAEPRLTFDAFLGEFGSFPTWLISQPIPFAHDRTDYKDFNAKHEHLFARIYREAQIQVPASWGDKPMGIVFEMMNKNSQFNILHNHLVPPPPIKGSTVRIHDPKALPDGSIYLEPLDFYLYSIHWPLASE